MNPSTPHEASSCHGGNIPCLQDPPADGRAESMFACTCGARFPGTLEGAWAAKLHTETENHGPPQVVLRGTPRAGSARAVGA